MRTAEADFARRVCDVFGLGQDLIALAAMSGSSTRLWELRTAAGRFSVKEFAYDAEDRSVSLAAAAEFEHGLWQSGELVMPEPVRAADGRLIVRVAGSRGREVTVRVHRWLDGTRVPDPPPLGAAAAAGASLAAIQQAGRKLGAVPAGTLCQWPCHPYDVLGRLQNSGLLSPGQAAAAETTLARGLAIVSAGERLPGSWSYTHCDHKPENALLVNGDVAVLDWDECGHFNLRLEAVEAALRWAGAYSEPEPEVFRAFLRGYEGRAGSLGSLVPADFAKWVAALASWFSFCGSRALGVYDDGAAERRSAAGDAVWSIEMLENTLASLERWAAELAGPPLTQAPGY